MSIETDARQEAERRWPSYPAVGFSGASDRQQAFIDGAVWASEEPDREPSDAEVEAAARALWDARRSPTNHTWDAIAEGGLNRPYPTYPHIVDDIRREARAALIAAQEVRRG